MGPRKRHFEVSGSRLSLRISRKEGRFFVGSGEVKGSGFWLGFGFGGLGFRIRV